MKMENKKEVRKAVELSDRNTFGPFTVETLEQLKEYYRKQDLEFAKNDEV